MEFSKTFFSIYVSLILFSGQALATDDIPLREAIQNKMVQLHAVADRVDEDTHLSLRISNLSAERISVVCGPGLLLEPEDPDFQNMLMTEPLIVQLPARSEKSLIVKVYCTEVDDRFPTEDLSYRLSAAVDEQLLSLAKYIHERPALHALESTIQSAVWAVSDEYGLSHIYHDEVNEVEDLRTFCSDLTGIEDVWYDMETDYSVNEEGMLVSEPLTIKGELTLTTKIQMKVQTFLVNEKGEEVWSPDRTLTVPKGEVGLWFELTVENWPVGTYTVLYKSGARTVLAQEFRI